MQTIKYRASKIDRKRIDKFQPSLSRVCNIVLPTTMPTHTHHIANPHSQKMAAAILWLRAHPRSISAAGTRLEEYHCRKVSWEGSHSH